MNPSLSALNPLALEEKSRIPPSFCRICGDEAKYSYFGAIVCQPCKMFFRRNALLESTKFICQFDGNCSIEKRTRHRCNACRLKKCFDFGMTSDKFRASIQRKKKRLSPFDEENHEFFRLKTLHSQKQIPALNLLRADQSRLTTNQWSLLSNILNSYQEGKIILLGRYLTDVYTNRRMPVMDCHSMIQTFLESIYDTAGTFIRCNADLNQLRFDDRSIILRSATDKVSCIGGSLALYQCNLFALKDFADKIAKIYGETSFNLTRWTLKFFDPDIILMKLGLALFAVSENILSHSVHPYIALHEPLAIWHIQNRYVEVTWKYLLYRYGYQDAIRRFLRLTCCFVAMTLLTVHLQNVSRHTSDVESIVEQTEVTLILDDVEQIMNT